MLDYLLKFFKVFNEKELHATQTDMSSDDFWYIILYLWMHLETDSKLKLLMKIFSDLGFDEQSDFYEFLGHCLNSDVYKESILMTEKLV